MVANLGRREGGSVYNTTPTVELILGADDHFIGITIHGDKAFGFLYLLHQISMVMAQVPISVQLIGRRLPGALRLAAWPSLFTELFASSKRCGMITRPDSL